MSIRVGLISDTHGFHAREMVEYFIASSGAEMLLVAGDLEDYRGYSKPTVFVRGNNESLPVLEELRLGHRRPDGLRYLPDGERISLAGHSVAAIGGKWGQPGKAGGKWIDPDALDRLSEGERPDIVVSHESPLAFPHQPDNDPRLAAACAAIAPRIWVSGHRHRYAEGAIGNTSVLALGNWPHDWATIELAPDHLGGPRRFAPDDPAYPERVTGWRRSKEREQVLLKELQGRPGRSRLVYGVVEPDNEHARRWLGTEPE
jgi:predicted phosphodiesterase